MVNKILKALIFIVLCAVALVEGSPATRKRESSHSDLLTSAAKGAPKSCSNQACSSDSYCGDVGGSSCWCFSGACGLGSPPLDQPNDAVPKSANAKSSHSDLLTAAAKGAPKSCSNQACSSDSYCGDVGGSSCWCFDGGCGLGSPPLDQEEDNSQKHEISL